MMQIMTSSLKMISLYLINERMNKRSRKVLNERVERAFQNIQVMDNDKQKSKNKLPTFSELSYSLTSFTHEPAGR